MNDLGEKKNKQDEAQQEETPLFLPTSFCLECNHEHGRVTLQVMRQKGLNQPRIALLWGSDYVEEINSCLVKPR